MHTRRLSLLLTLFLAIGGGPVGCDDPVEHPPAIEEAKALRRSAAAGDAVVVAQVRGRALGVEALEAYWRRYPELTREQALRGLVEQELWAQQADAQGLVEKGELEDARRQGLARALLRREVLEAVGPQAVDAARLEEAIRAQVEGGERPAGARVSHLLVRVPKEDPATGQELDATRRAALMERAEGVARRAREQLEARSNLLQLGEVARELTVDPPLQVRLEPHLVTALREEDGELPAGWISTVAPFRNAVAEMARRGAGRGAVSEPVATEFGWHVILLEEPLEAQRPSAEEARTTALERLVQEVRAERTGELVERLRAGAHLELRPEALEGQQEAGVQGSAR